jgi:hypothetical protein
MEEMVLRDLTVSYPSVTIRSLHIRLSHLPERNQFDMAFAAVGDKHQNGESSALSGCHIDFRRSLEYPRWDPPRSFAACRQFEVLQHEERITN